MTALTDDSTFQVHDFAVGDVRDDPAWRELMGIDAEEEDGDA